MRIAPERFSREYQDGLERVKRKIVMKMWGDEEKVGMKCVNALMGYVYVAELDEILVGDYVRYVSFDGGDLKKGGRVMSIDDESGNIKLMLVGRFWSIKYDDNIIFRRKMEYEE